jgi:hypothetical protein
MLTKKRRWRRKRRKPMGGMTGILRVGAVQTAMWA